MPVKKITLKYKASTIAKFEEETGRGFLELISHLDGSGTPKMSELLMLFKAGGASEKDFDEVAAEGVQELVLTIMSGINDAGFLGKIDIEGMRKAMEEAAQQVIASSPQKA